MPAFLDLLLNSLAGEPGFRFYVAPIGCFASDMRFAPAEEQHPILSRHKIRPSFPAPSPSQSLSRQLVPGHRRRIATPPVVLGILTEPGAH